MPRQPPQPAPSARARAGPWIAFLVAAALVATLTYLGYAALEGSRMMTARVAPWSDCRTPASLGWDYEPINHEGLARGAPDAEADPLWCLRPDQTAGDELVASDGTRLAAWFIPSAAPIEHEDETVVLVHGWGGTKSSMLAHAELLRERYNVVALDLRLHGQSSGQLTTQGLHEQRDLRALLDWLEAQKHPRRVAVLGVSLGAATALVAAQHDERIDALILDSVHATLLGTVRVRIEQAGFPLSLPASRAVLLGGLLRTGEDLSSADPVRTIAEVGRTPVLLLHGGADPVVPADHAAQLRDAALDAGVPIELRRCPTAGHGALLDACPTEYRSWVLGFLERAFGR